MLRSGHLSTQINTDTRDPILLYCTFYVYNVYEYIYKISPIEHYEITHPNVTDTNMPIEYYAHDIDTPRLSTAVK